MQAWFTSKISGQNLGEKQDINSLKGSSSRYLLTTKGKNSADTTLTKLSRLTSLVKYISTSGNAWYDALTGYNKFIWYSYPKYITST